MLTNNKFKNIVSLLDTVKRVMDLSKNTDQSMINLEENYIKKGWSYIL